MDDDIVFVIFMLIGLMIAVFAIVSSHQHLRRIRQQEKERVGR